MPDLIVQIKADLTNYIAGMKQAGNISASAANDITAQLAKAAQAQENLGGATMSTSMKFMQMRSGLSAARDGLIGVTQSGVRADNALMAMGHHFTTLVSETGSVQGAFSALGSSLIGPGGLILGITLAVELWNRYSKSQSEAEKSAKSYIETLDGVTQAELKGKQMGEAELVRMKILYQATQDHTLSLQERNRAYDELADKYPKFFSNADREKTLLGENTAGYNALANSILAAASAKAYENKIGENQNKIFENQQKITGIDNTINLLKDTKAARNSAQNKQTVGPIDFASDTRDEIALNKQIEEKNKLLKENNQLTDENNQLTNLAYSSEKAANFETTQQLDKKNKTIKEAKTYLETLESQLKKLQSVEDAYLAKGGKQKFGFDVLTADDQSIANRERDIRALTAQIENLKAVNAGENTSPFQTGAVNTNGGLDLSDRKGDGNTVTKANAKVIEEMDASLAKHELALNGTKNATRAYNQELKDEQSNLRDVERLLGDGLVSAFNESLTQGKNFFASLGDELLKMVEKLAETAAAAEALALILQFTGLGTFLGISASAASFGSIFSGMSGIKLASGGITNGPTHALIGEGNEREAVMPLSKLQKFVNTNGSGGMMTGEIKLNGSNLLLGIVRAEATKQRRG